LETSQQPASLPAQQELFGISTQVIVLGIARFADAFGNSLLFVVLPLYFDNFKNEVPSLPPELTIGILIGLGPLVSFIVQPFAGTIADHTNRYKLITLIGLAVTGAAIIGFVFSSSVMHLAICRALQGAGVGLTVPTALALTSLYSRIGNRGRSMSFFIGARMLGLGAGPLMGGILLVEYSFAVSLLAAAALVFIGFFGVVILVKEPDKPEPLEHESSDRISFRSILQQRGFLVIALINVVMAISINILAPLENSVNQRLDQTAADFGIALSLSLFTNFFFQFASGPLADRFGRKPVIVFGLCILAPATTALPFATSTEMLWLIQMLEGAATAFIGSPSYALAGDMSKRRGVGKQLSILTACFGLGLAIGPLLAGIFAGYIGFHAPFLVAGVVTFFVAFLAIYSVKDVNQESK